MARAVMRQSGRTSPPAVPFAPGSCRTRPSGSHPATGSPKSRSRRSGRTRRCPVIGGDETKALVGVEPLHCSCCHQFKSSICHARTRPRRADRELTAPGQQPVPPPRPRSFAAPAAAAQVPAHGPSRVHHRPVHQAGPANPRPQRQLRTLRVERLDLYRQPLGAVSPGASSPAKTLWRGLQAMRARE